MDGDTLLTFFILVGIPCMVVSYIILYNIIKAGVRNGIIEARHKIKFPEEYYDFGEENGEDEDYDDGKNDGKIYEDGAQV